MTKKISDEAFLETWNRHRSPTIVARIFGMDVRGIMKRRRNIEGRYGIELATNEEPRQLLPKEGAQLNATVTDGSVVIFGDVHVDPNDGITLGETALCAVLAALADAGDLRGVILNGDLLDFPTISRHPATEWAHMPTVVDELEAAQGFMARIEEHIPDDVWCNFHFGNHDQRHAARLAQVAPEFVGVNGMDLTDHLSRRWQYAWNTRINEGVMYSDTIIKHRWKGGLHAGFNNTLWAGTSICTNHLHRLSVTPLTDANGRRYGVDAGMLAPFIKERRFLYIENSPVNWATGFAVMTWRDGKLLPPELCEIVRDEVAFFRGKAVACR